jgi:hypothetical protein
MERIFTYKEFNDYFRETFGYYTLSFTLSDRFENASLISLVAHKIKRTRFARNLLKRILPMFDVNVIARKSER